MLCALQASTTSPIKRRFICPRHQPHKATTGLPGGRPLRLVHLIRVQRGHRGSLFCSRRAGTGEKRCQYTCTRHREAVMAGVQSLGVYFGCAELEWQVPMLPVSGTGRWCWKRCGKVWRIIIWMTLSLERSLMVGFIFLDF